MVIITAKITHRERKEITAFYHTDFTSSFHYWSWTEADVFDNKEEAEEYLKNHPPIYGDPNCMVSAPEIIELPL